MLCVQTNATLDDDTRFKFDGSGYYVKSSEEMRKIFPQNKYPKACDNTLEIAERIKYSFSSPKYYLPAFPVPEENISAEEYLSKKVFEGAKEVYQDITKEIKDRIN